MTEFSRSVMSIVKKIPKGKVASYGQVARLAGKPNGARGVGWILNSTSETHNLPWQRVINSKGKISFPIKSDEHKLQKSLLKKEGVKFSLDGSIDFSIYGWSRKLTRPKRQRGKPSMFSE